MSNGKAEILIKFLVLIVIFAVVAKISNFTLISSKQIVVIPGILELVDLIAYHIKRTIKRKRL